MDFLMPSSAVKSLWEVFVWGFGVLFLSCACVSVSGGLVLRRCVYVCDLLICLHCPRRHWDAGGAAPPAGGPCAREPQAVPDRVPRQVRCVRRAADGDGDAATPLESVYPLFGLSSVHIGFGWPVAVLLTLPFSLVAMRLGPELAGPVPSCVGAAGRFAAVWVFRGIKSSVTVTVS